MDRIRNRWLKNLKTAGSGSAASSDKIVVDIGMVGLIYMFTLCAIGFVTAIWLLELIWKRSGRNKDSSPMSGVTSKTSFVRSGYD